MHYVIRPMTGWEENFADKEAALKRAAEIIRNDEEGMRTRQNYKKPEELIEEAWDSIEEMYQFMPLL